MADADERNVISGNVRHGVQIVTDADHNVVAGNFIGTDLTGTGALGNGQDGVLYLASTPPRTVSAPMGTTSPTSPNATSSPQTGEPAFTSLESTSTE